LLELGRKGEASTIEMEDGFAPGLADATQQTGTGSQGGAAAEADGYGGVNSDGGRSPPGRTLALSVLVTAPSPGRVLIEVFAKHWVVDRSGLGLACGARKHMVGFQPKQPGSVPCGRGATALQTLVERGRNALEASAPAAAAVAAYEEGWALGEGGLSLLRSSKDHLVVALPTNTPFARPSLDPQAARALRDDPAVSAVLSVGLAAAKADNVFSLLCGERSVELCYEVTSGVGAFEHSKVVRVCARFAVLNPDPTATLLVRQEGTPDDGAHVVAVPPRGKAFYHWSNAKAPRRLLVRFLDPSHAALSTGWSFGGVAIEAVGATPLWLPPPASAHPPHGALAPLDAKALTVVHVEVQLAGDHQDSASNLLVERLPASAARFNPSAAEAARAAVPAVSGESAVARGPMTPLLAAQNDTRQPLVLRQGAAPSSAEGVAGVPAVTWVLQPGEAMPFGWLAPCRVPKEVWAAAQALPGSAEALPGSAPPHAAGNAAVTDADEDGGVEFDDDGGDDDDTSPSSPSSPSVGGGGGGGSKKKGLLRSMGSDLSSDESEGKRIKQEHCFKMLEMAGAGAKPKRLVTISGAVAAAAAVVPVRGTRLLLFASTGKALQAFRAERSESTNSSPSSRRTGSNSAAAGLAVSLAVSLPEGIGLSVLDDFGDSASGLVGSGLASLRREVLYLAAGGIALALSHDANADQADLVLQARARGAGLHVHSGGSFCTRAGTSPSSPLAHACVCVCSVTLLLPPPGFPCHKGSPTPTGQSSSWRAVPRGARRPPPDAAQNQGRGGRQRGTCA
jgi:hypothetical protein